MKSQDVLKTKNLILSKRKYCCKSFGEDYLDRIPPPKTSKAFGWFAKNPLKAFVDNEKCPITAVLSCELKAQTNGTNVYLEIYKNGSRLYEEHVDNKANVILQCNPKEMWTLDGRLFDDVACSQS
uniref:C6 domain-containing protein n=1 Tax=Rhabditophanes sp. KR3021 TaxID=114890 RepID=A0AC35UAW2_9BILA